MSEEKEFDRKNSKNIKLMSKNNSLKKTSLNWFVQGYDYQYSYHFKWLGRPIIQYPQDIVALQEIIWEVKPDIIIETGIARGGSLIFSASILEIIGKGKIIGVDIDIREHNKKSIEKHPLFKRIRMVEGSSIDEEVVKKIKKFVKPKDKVMVILDSNHTHEHVLREMELYSPLIKKGSFLIVFDTIIEDLPNRFFKNRPWNKKDNPKTAVREFLSKNNRFKIDRSITDKILISAAPEGYLRCIK